MNFGTGFRFGEIETAVRLYRNIPAASISAFEFLPGREYWQSYLDAAPQTAESFAKDPLRAILSFLPTAPLEFLSNAARGYAEVFLFLLAVAAISFLMGDTADADLLELLSTVGCGVLLWDDLAKLAQLICEKMTDWRIFILGFLPVYGGVLAVGGEGNAGASSCGLLLSGLCLLAQCTALWVGPLLQSYLAVSMACSISTQKGLSEGCRVTGMLLRKGLHWAGRIFAVLLGLQRMVTFQLDRTTLRMGQFLTGSVPVIGEALSGAAETLLMGLQLLKSALGLAALLILGAEFVPLYLTLMLHLAFLQLCIWICDFTESRRCRALLECLSEAVQCMAAVTALFFELLLVGVTALMLVGGG